MFTLNFKVDQKFLASYAIANCERHRFVDNASDSARGEVADFQNLAWDLSKDLYKLIDGRELIGDFALTSNLPYQDIGTKLDEYFDELIRSKEFGIISKSTEDAVLKIEDEWNRNYGFCSEYIKSLGINLDGDFTAFLVHPALKAGRYLGDNKILWSYRTDWPNYNTVYIWHEMLHSYFDRGDGSHAIIELITDEELRFRLNKEKYPPFVGHDFLEKIKAKGLPTWKKYLENPDKDIKQLIKDFEEYSPA